MTGTRRRYSARTSYQDTAVATNYEEDRFRSALGRYTWQREQRSVAELLSRWPADLEILDCPCGTGRWWPRLAPKARRLVGADVSVEMQAEARRRAERLGLSVELVEADAEQLPFADDEFDVVFSFALTKHLPTPVQHRVLAEFARVSRRGVISTFGIFNPVSYLVWRRRGLVESFPVLPEEVGSMARQAGLRIAETRPCTTPIGTERLVRFEPAP